MRLLIPTRCLVVITKYWVTASLLKPPVSFSVSLQTPTLWLLLFLKFLTNLISILIFFFSSSQWYNSNLHIPSLSQFPGQVSFFKILFIYFFFNFSLLFFMFLLVVCWYSHVHNLSDPPPHPFYLFFYYSRLIRSCILYGWYQIPRIFFMIFFFSTMLDLCSHHLSIWLNQNQLHSSHFMFLPWHACFYYHHHHHYFLFYKTIRTLSC